jgi:hypothetical protein
MPARLHTRCVGVYTFYSYKESAVTEVLISFEEQNVRVGRKWLFERREHMRFEWLALLAIKRATEQMDQSWVTLNEIARLPSWRGKSRHHISTNIGRYLESRELRSKLVSAATMWSGPYCLSISPARIKFDLSRFRIAKALQLRAAQPPPSRRYNLLAFTFSYARAHYLLFQGRLSSTKEEPARENAYDRLAKLSEDSGCGSTLRLLACLAATDVPYRRGRIRVARQFLLRHSMLARTVPDMSLRAQYYLKLAWAYQRASSGRQSDRAVESALDRAGSYAESSGDRAALALLNFRWGGYLTKTRHHREAINKLLLALEGYLITGNYDGVQATCGNLGSVTHRLGEKHYGEAKDWLVLSLAIARWMEIGRDDAHAEMILGKVYTELGNQALARIWLSRAERVAQRAGGRINLADIKMVWGIFYKRFGTRDQLIETLATALRLFRDLKEFDVAQKEKYMERIFPEVWGEVLDHRESSTSDSLVCSKGRRYTEHDYSTD